MDLQRTPLLIEGQPVPVPPGGMMRKTSYPAGQSDADDEYPCDEEGKKLAKAHAWQFPSKRVKVCGKTLRY